MEERKSGFQSLIDLFQNGIELPKSMINIPDYSSIYKQMETATIDYEPTQGELHIEQIKDNTNLIVNEFIRLNTITATQSNEISDLKTIIQKHEKQAKKNKRKERFIGALITIICELIVFLISFCLVKWVI